MTATTITTLVSTGKLRGIRENGVDRYLAIPYAAAPVGRLRFAAPAPVPGWPEVRDATAMGPTSPQNEMSPVSQKYLPNVIIPGDDYLNVNVWTPEGAQGLPVMVWFHGGSLKHGSNALDGYDGRAFARDGVVFVSVNYRLGFEGFSVLDDAPENIGYADMVASLRWVHDEIVAFGGDPGRVTILGESAGGVAVANLLAGTHAGTLFQQVIVQSGMPAASSRRDAAVVTRSEAKMLGIPTTRTAFSAVPMERMLEADRAVTRNPGRMISGTGYAPVIGGPEVEKDPMAAVLDGAGDHVPVMAGWTSEEHTYFMLPGAFDRIGRLLFGLVRLKFGATRNVVKAYRDAYPGAARGYLTAVMTIDRILRIPMHRIADGRRARGAAPTWFYEFDWKSPVDGLGATHAMDVPFVFDTLGSPDWPQFTGPNPPQRIADEMHAAWVRFATTGDPGWRAWDDSRPTLVFGDPASRLVEDPRGAQLRVWKKRRGDRS
ncbi:carboxylesterase/lipase family protein [Phycicoccus sp. CSK15P-2]|uniref:carboxylesterase/lipase family protein n=1 Tax=Phycicoccus sp. CSK15P-2 TaxID=2807627 RepID=UPI0019524C86|nr:carboxylesterase family protein [Phycicoccus sp. CSK15P-2]MBM6403051.1 carboxylesterase/lipase family protein [Phycicoccus sp. CSK15P-2]